MIFNSLEFLVFAILFFLLWPLFRRKDNSRWGFIVIASFVFYGWWDWRFLFLIVASGLIDYLCGSLIMSRPSKKKVFLILSLVGNLGSLSIFKYSSFFAKILEDVFLVFSLKVDLGNTIPEFALILPVGISFYTFQSLSYTIDIYKGNLKPTKNILHFFSYLSMFPQLVAGPIVRARDFLYQLETYKIPTSIQKWNGVKLIVYGLFQKMVIADNLSFLIDSAFENKSPYDSSLFWWVVMLGFSFQIYADFSGYSLIARGLAKLMGYHFKMNFNHPYISKSLREFWTRWHISLSSWFRDYVYIPLGGSRKGKWMSITFLSITMLLSGLWHGANYTFIIWAALHAFFLAFERITKWPKRINKFYGISIIIVFVQALLGWVYFRASDVSQANLIVFKLFSFQFSDLHFLTHYFNSVVVVLLAVIIESLIFIRKTNRKAAIWFKKGNFDVFLVSLGILAILMFRGEGKQFIYFQF